MRKIRLAILISGRGSNMEALVKACKKKSFPAEVALVISNKRKAKGLENAEKAGIATKVIEHGRYESRDAFEEKIHDTMKEAEVDLVCLAGFMRILNPGLVNRWRDRIINIHPSLLPAFKGLHTHERVLEAGARFTGCTVHFVSPEMDSGPIIIQAVVPVLPEDTPKDLARRVLKYEHRIYPEAVRLIGEGKVRVSGNLVQIKEPAETKGGMTNPPVE